MPRPARLIAPFLLLVLLAAPGAAQEAGTADAALQAEAEVPTAPVEVDGIRLFTVRGAPAYPATERAAAIAERIVALADDPAFELEDLAFVESDLGIELRGGDRLVMVVTEADAELQRLTLRQTAEVIRRPVAAAIERYRRERSPETLWRSAAAALAATALLVGVLVPLIWLARRQVEKLKQRFEEHIRPLAIGSFEFVRAERLRGLFAGALRLARTAVVFVLVFLYLQYVLGRFPQTRGAAHRLSGWILDPLATMGRQLAAKIPDLAFLVVIALVTRYVLRLMRLFFQAVARRELQFARFEPEWADPTYKLLRILVVACAVVVAYPYIPGSDSAAFKGISLFLGVLVSLGSSSVISNLIAGYAMNFRRPFRTGDLVRVGDTIGEVTDIRLQVTHLRTPKNEHVILPNASILNAEVMNYSTHARDQGLILHTSVGIGYEVPWRQVEAMLLQAAERTPGVLAEPRPFVLQTALGDFAISYQLNAYTRLPQPMGALYAELHRRILDVFNEHGVQIMTPAYEGDPEEPKLVPRGQWYPAPATAPEPDVD